jgi:hypothetical protein
MKSTLKEYMSAADAKAMGTLATWHSTCIEKTNKARPGKTARDKRGVRK